MTDVELEQLVDSILSRKSVKSVYQPVIDLSQEVVYAYEVFTRIESKKRVNILDLFNYAKDANKFERLQQTLMINGVENFETITSKEARRLFVNADFNSYEKYVNKPRLYDMMGRNKIVIEFQNYEKIEIDKLRETIEKIRSNNGMVSLDKFGTNSFSFEKLNLLNLDFITTDVSLIKNLAGDIEKQRYLADLATYCLSRNINLLVVGVEDKLTLEYVKKAGVRFVQGFYFAKPDYKIMNINTSVKEKLEEFSQETIS
jgi:EAL domain-containing protein (putative c-di-GMP-specific phosphodiesterase class I)